MLDYNYVTSEQLFLDIWQEYGCPTELYNKNQITEILSKIVEKSETHIVLDHYSEINFDYISKIESKDNYTLIYWFDKNNFRKKYLDKSIDEFDILRWQMFGYATYEYFLLDISKIKFIKVKDHLLLLLLSNLIPQREISKFISNGGQNEIIEEDPNTSELYTRYSFWEGNPENCIKHFCLVSNLPYYTCVIQPKENISVTIDSKIILLCSTIDESLERLHKAQIKLTKAYEYDYDEIFSIGNTIRRILEYTLKYYCVINEIDLSKIQIEQKYGHIKLGDLRKLIIEKCNIKIQQSLINIANELSHDSGAVFSKGDINSFCLDSIDLANQLANDLINFNTY